MHHWRVNLARPSRNIDLAFGRKDPEAVSSKKVEESAGQEDDHDFDYDNEPMKDLTACDKECGYCGNCDY